MTPEERKFLKGKGFTFDQITALEKVFNSNQAKARRYNEQENLRERWSFLRWLLETGKIEE